MHRLIVVFIKAEAVCLCPRVFFAINTIYGHMMERGWVCETAGAAVVLGTSFFPLCGGFSNVSTKKDYPFWIQGMFLTYFWGGKVKLSVPKIK